MASIILPRAWEQQPFVPAGIRPDFRDALVHCQSAGGALRGTFGFSQLNPSTLDRYGSEGVELYADHGGSVDDRFAILEQLNTARAGPMTTIMSFTMKDSGHDIANFLKLGYGHFIGFTGGRIITGYKGGNGYEYLFKNNDAITYDRAYYVNKTFTVVISTSLTPKAQTISVHDGGRQVPLTLSSGSESYVGGGTLAASLSSAYIGESAYANYYHPKCTLRIWAIIPRFFPQADVDSFGKNPWQILERSPLYIPFSVGGTFDVVPSGATVQSITSTGATPKCTITRTGSSPAGTLYYVIYPDGLSAPSAAQVIAGQDSTGSAATASGNEACRTTTGDQIFASPATGCAASTAYRIAFVASDGVTPSAVAVSAAAFTTLSAAISVTGASSTQSNAGTAGAIQQTHLIGATSSTQANAGTTGTVQQTHLIGATSSTQANAGTTGTVQQTHRVSGASSTQANTGTAGTVQQTHLIGATSSTQANAGTTGTVQQTHRVSGASSTQANTGTAGSISTETVAYVTGASSTQGNTGSAGAIQQTHMVGAASSTQSNIGTAGSIHVAGAVAVVGADSTQSNTGSAGSIQQTHRVGAANSTCAAVGSAGSILQVHLIICADSTQRATGSAGSIGDVVISDIALAAQRQRNTNTARRGRANLASTGRYNVN